MLTQSLGRAATHEREVESAREHARSTAPKSLPAIPGIEIGVAVGDGKSGVDNSDTGGWYDVLQPQPFRALLALGHVRATLASHSMAAAVRNALLAYSVISQRPDELAGHAVGLSPNACKPCGSASDHHCPVRC